MTETRVKISTIVQSQLPDYVKSDYPVAAEFLQQYYRGVEYQGAPVDLIDNIDDYTKIDNVTNLTTSVVLKNNTNSTTTTIEVDEQISPLGTYGFPSTYGLIKIGDEVITYTGKTDFTFTGCIRGFSGICDLKKEGSPEEVVFEDTNSQRHSKGEKIQNLSVLFLQEFLKKIKSTYAPGFQEREFYSNIDQNIFIKQSKDFYASKGTEESFKILFKVLYGENVTLLSPSEQLFRPSDANYDKVESIIVEEVTGDPSQLVNLTLFQDKPSKSYAPIAYVETVGRPGIGKTYYRLDIDAGYNRNLRVDGSVYGEFKPTPKTRITTSVAVGASHIDVDSTVGFAQTGNLFVQYGDGGSGVIYYGSKNLTQFTDTDIILRSIPLETEIADNDIFAYSGDTKVRITNILSLPSIPKDSHYYRKGDIGRIKTLGIGDTGFKASSWLTNNRSVYTVNSISVADLSDNSYFVTLNNPHYIYVGDVVELERNDGVIVNSRVSSLVNDFSLKIFADSTLDISRTYILRRNIERSAADYYQGLDNLTSNVQGVYKDNSDDSFLIASSSLPNYKILLPSHIKEVTGTFVGDTFKVNGHGFFTGDEVWYSSQKVGISSYSELYRNTVSLQTASKLFEDGLYYAYRVDGNNIKLAQSLQDLYFSLINPDQSKFISLEEPVTVAGNTIQREQFYEKDLSTQKLIRQFNNPEEISGIYPTHAGYTGMLLNGVEILNYKSHDNVYYGKIEDIEVTSTDRNFDVINPPNLLITDDFGSQASGALAVSGDLKEIRILDRGFDYEEPPIVSITGGNGSGAIVSVMMKALDHQTEFDASSSIFVNLSESGRTIGFSTYHKFRDFEVVQYKTNSQRNIVGLTTNAQYYVKSIDATTIKLYNKLTDAISGINTIRYNGLGVGKHILRSIVKKNVVEALNVIDSGDGYQNRKTFAQPIGIQTSNNTINIKSHGYNTGDALKYFGSTEGTANQIGGINSITEYYVTVVDNDNFKLSETGTGTIAKDFYAKTRQFKQLTYSGVGTHTFNYPPISVTLTGKVGLASTGNETFTARVQPIFRGEITAANIANPGVGYGVTDIINYHRKPFITYSQGKDSQLKPVVYNGGISEVIVMNSGSGYVSTPDLNIIGPGNGAILTPVMDNGRIVSIFVVEPGVGYDQDNVSVTATPPQIISRSKFDCNIQKWKVNLFTKNFNFFTLDDGVLDVANKSSNGIEYAHMYGPRELRKSLYSRDQNGEKLYGLTDLRFNGTELNSDNHSPIIGWAYDGNPIYGPYGFENVDGTGDIVRMTSGYVLDATDANRPDFNAFPSGFFVDDFEYRGDGLLDEHNGRFCVTPDYPNGVYAYFTTISEVEDSTGPFKNYLRPVFPYLIGDSFKSKPNEFNFKSFNNQNDYNIESDGWFRNSSFYFTNDTEGNSQYDYIFNSNRIIDQGYDVRAASAGVVDSVIIESKGQNYKVNDKIDFNNEGTGGRGLDIKVSRVDGPEVHQVSVATTFFQNVEFVPSFSRNEFVGYTPVPHGFETGDIVNVSEITGVTSYFDNFDGSYPINVRTEFLNLSLGVQEPTQTGIVTYFYVNGNLTNEFVRENDVYQVGAERVKVLNVDRKSRRLRVLRQHQNTVGTSYSSTTLLTDRSRNFSISVPGIQTTRSLVANREFYFDPRESLGVGTDTTAGIGNTIVFSNPGVGRTTIFLTPQQLYIPNHNLSLNDEMSYETNGGTAIEVWTGVAGDLFQNITDYTTFYAVPQTVDIIGVSTVKIGIGTTSGSYAGITTNDGSGLLYFTTVGAGDTHSFTTNHDNVLKAETSKNIVTVALAVTHSMKSGDNVIVDIKPTDIVNIDVSYNDFNRRLVFDPVGFVTAGISTTNNTITINNHTFRKGDKVLYTSDDPVIGLQEDGMYYVIPYTRNSIRLVSEKFEVSSDNPNFVGLTSAAVGMLYKVNPEIRVQKNNRIRFGLSDSSLSYINNTDTFSAFDFDLFTDIGFTNEFYTSKTTKDFEVTKNGKIGVDTNAYVEVLVSDQLPSNLYYNVTPVNLDLNPTVKQEIVTDRDVPNNNQFNIINNDLDGNHTITGVGSTSFDYSISVVPTTTIYTSSNAVVDFNTNSLTQKGPINKFKILGQGAGYKTLPGFVSVTSSEGSGALVDVQSNTVGKILNVTSNNIGFDYPTDTTMRGVANLPEILQVTPLGSFESIGISSGGVNYVFAPDLVVKDGFTNDLITDAQLKYELGDNEVTISKNTTQLYNVTPNIYPINNSNGFSISTVSYTQSTKTVRLTLETQFSEGQIFPFEVGKNIIVENINIGVGTTGKGYNSSDYGYDIFEMTAVDDQFGGANAFVEYKLDKYLTGDQVPGTIIGLSVARVTPQVWFPIFNPKVVVDDFKVGETVDNLGNLGVVERWDPTGQLLYVSTRFDYQVGTSLTSFSSNITSVINQKIEYDAEILTGAGATIVDGWQTISGFLNENLQVIPNNEYYQNFSYSLKSRVPYETWNDSVSSLNHVAGFDKYSDLVIETTGQRTLAPVDIDLETIVDLDSVFSRYCYPDFDQVSERTVDVNGVPISNQIVFENRILQDYFESRGNRVLSIDNISGQFDSNARGTAYQPIGVYSNDDHFVKIFTFARDTDLLSNSQFAIVSVLQDGTKGYLNQYARVNSVGELGWYGYTGSDDNWKLDFYPYDFEYNNYSVSAFSINSSQLTGIGSTDIGDTVNIIGIHTVVPAGITTTTVVSISNTYRASKALIQFEDSDGNYYANELNILQDGTDVKVLQYGDLTNNTELTGITGFGTYDVSVVGQNIVVDFIPSVSAALSCTGSVVAIATATANNGISSLAFRTAEVSSFSTSITSSATPGITTFATFTDPQSAGYFFVSVEDTTNNEYELVEVAAIDTQFNKEGFTEYGEIVTSSGLGTIGINTSGTGTNLVFTPLANIDVEIRAFGITLMTYDNNTRFEVLDLENTKLISTHGDYTGTEYDKNTSFPLDHNDLPIFHRYFEGNDSSVVDITNNRVNINDHYFVTGEKVTYSYEGSDNITTNAIGIDTVSIAGVNTDKLPTELYIVKVNESNISFAQSATAALKKVPEVLDITSVGIGTFHKLVSTRQNAKALLAIDNMIQAPVTNTLIETELTNAIVFDTNFPVPNTNGIQATDLIRVEEELMTVLSIGVGATNNVQVLRAQMGTRAVPHGAGSTVSVMGGNYNIIDSTVHFASAPFGLTPIGTTTGSPDDVSYAGIQTFSTFQGRTFMRSGEETSDVDTYSSNYIFDNIQIDFDGVTNEFALTQDGQNLTGFSTNQAIILNSNILQEPQGDQFTTGDIDFLEDAGITSIRYTGTSQAIGYDPLRSGVPIGGVIISVGSTGGNGYQPLVAAGGTVTISGLGTVNNVSIANSGSGYRSGIQQVINAYVQSESLGVASIFGIGTASVIDGHIVSVAITDGGSGYSVSEPPILVFDDPLPYGNIPLIYSSDSQPGTGQSATVDLEVGIGGSIINFEINNPGFAYSTGDILTVSVGGTTGIPTNTSQTFEEFQLTIDDNLRDTFNGWTIGELDVFDKLDEQFNGEEKNFNLAVDKQVYSIVTQEGSLIDLEQNLLVFINDVLQVPGQAYTFNGGSVIKFSEAPKRGDTSKIIFYKGTPDIDVVFVDILETVKIGDTLNINNDTTIGQDKSLDQNSRVVTGISTLQTVDTNPYVAPGVSTDTSLLRPVTWCKQTDDIYIDGKPVTKDRVDYESVINPVALLTRDVGINSTHAYVESVRPLFDQANETTLLDYQFEVTITDQCNTVGAAAVATLNGGGINVITMTEKGEGYMNLQNPSVSITAPGLTTAGKATATAVVSGDRIDSITVTNAGSGYTVAPNILIEPPHVIKESLSISTYRGDEGQIVGYAFSTGGLNTLDFFIPTDSFLRDPLYAGIGITVSMIEAGDRFVIRNSNVGIGGTTRIDGIFDVKKAYTVNENVDVLGYSTAFRRVEYVSVGVGTTNFSSTLQQWDTTLVTLDNGGQAISGDGIFRDDRIYGQYSYGRMDFENRDVSVAKSFTAEPYGNLNCSSLVTRSNRLRFVGYATAP